LFFDTMPDIFVLAGTALVALAGIFIAVREHGLGRASRLEAI
jgi:hypothetical protein